MHVQGTVPGTQTLRLLCIAIYCHVKHNFEETNIFQDVIEHCVLGRKTLPCLRDRKTSRSTNKTLFSLSDVTGYAVWGKKDTALFKRQTGIPEYAEEFVLIFCCDSTLYDRKTLHCSQDRQTDRHPRVRRIICSHLLL